MNRHEAVRQHLARLEQVLRDHRHWRSELPDSAALNSTQPFCMDTLEPEGWLQWVLIPRMQVLLDCGHPLPQAFAVTPYYEMALDASAPGREILLAVLSDLDALFTADDDA
ncbi:YqcC family protein [Entomohabitans teleogrylli]|uniref:YqcC family protein n=1 Tax=Entomohabitans teleogrylli TaxID=1384589 RepID=UPI00073D544D|nr:YqcC family protein [Entomohabitans teleogrylli]